ncbi:M20 metallopeptidase family protein [Desmospora profundinema]|uniref:Amidohydrolase n=1 Tax=Desmospora profundinema TaxID=1571184 RepID=A0ABU1IH48_9BACL|nr:amidohydrolase [Desmospora profundinema]MDR6224098.1 amidohydrolase [Desmospora profundinema]
MLAIREWADRAWKIQPQLIQWRRHLHQYPELSFQEFQTAKWVADQLRRTPGVQVQTEVGGTGVVGTLAFGPGPHIALRADMDALPILESEDRPYRSRTPGVMHACGHDAHTAMLLGAARLLAETAAAGEVKGTVRFLFQPAEENSGPDGLTGAPRMIADGALDGVERILALHVDPELPVGSFRVNDGFTMASVDTFTGTLIGTGGHGAYPDRGVDPTWILLPVLQVLHGITARRVSPLEPAVISIGRIHAGMASNIIPAEVELEGTIRCRSPELRERLIAEVEGAFSLASSLGGDYRFRVVRGEPALQNDPEVNRQIIAAIRKVVPDGVIQAGPHGLGAEDFSHMVEKVPGAMFFLGCAESGGVRRELHTPTFDLDEQCLSLGAVILAETAKRLLCAASTGEGR